MSGCKLALLGAWGHLGRSASRRVMSAPALSTATHTVAAPPVSGVMGARRSAPPLRHSPCERHVCTGHPWVIAVVDSPPRLSPFACSEDVPQGYSLTNNSGHSSFGDFSSPDYLDNVTLEDLGEGCFGPCLQATEFSPPSVS